ncbi:hypothetical protein ACFJIY_25015 [Pimelobacter simplex]|uniref:hypothetical protein n=1 Tax=Nocardioides simplex TaxID=2045 RepID=UPI00366E6629
MSASEGASAFDEAVSLFLTEQVDVTVESIHATAVHLGRNWYPALVYHLYREGMLSGLAGESIARAVVPAAWSDAEFPMIQLEPDEWRDLFEHIGYTVDGVAAERPSGPLTLWRGAAPGYEKGFAWTEDREKAQWFANRPHHKGGGLLLTADVRPAWLFARITNQRPGESEYVVDTDGIDIREV